MSQQKLSDNVHNESHKSAAKRMKKLEASTKYFEFCHTIEMICNMGCGGGQVVSLLTFYSDDPGLSNDQVYKYYWNFI